MMVGRDDELGICFQGALDDAVVVWIVGHGLHWAGWVE